MDYHDSDTMRTNLLISLFKQAMKTFCPKNSCGEFHSQFHQLKTILDQVKAEHVRLDPTFHDLSFWRKEGKAPCTYIEIFENQVFNMSIFILKPGFKMPLHDHPHMHGMLKVISGAVRIKSFTKIKSENVQQQNLNTPLDEFQCSETCKPFLAEISDFKICDANTESCILTPDDSNYHEIEAVDGPSAFLDILAPPYSTYIRDDKVRKCRYYKVLQEISSNMVQLEEIPAPRWFYCDQAPYLGPVLI